MARNDARNQQSDEELDQEALQRSEAIVQNIDEMLGQMQLSLYGTKHRNDVDGLLSQFNDIVRNQINGINRHQGEETASFLDRLYSNDKRASFNYPDLETFLNADEGELLAFVSDAYKNKMMKYEDLAQISSQLIELKEAILIMRDAIISPDTTEGTIARIFNYDLNDAEEQDRLTSILEKMEADFKLQPRIKNHIVVNTLTFGSYYVYILPYSKIFTDFAKKREDPLNGPGYISDALHNESTLWDLCVKESASDKPWEKKETEDPAFLSEAASQFVENFSTEEMAAMLHKVGIQVSPDDERSKLSGIMEERVEKELKEYMENITINNEEVPLPYLLEGTDAINELMRLYPKEFGKDAKNLFQEVTKVEQGIYGSKEYKQKAKKSERDFKDVSGCYIKLIDPKKMLPIKIMEKVIGYYYIQDDDVVTNTATLLASSVYFNKYEQNGKSKSVVDAIVSRIVTSFNKKFLNDNMEMKELIASALMYYDLNMKRLKFQFIPAEYVVEFKINEDPDGNGTSMIDGSLFYAKLYLMLLLFKITSIVLYSNDTKVNYVKTSGVDKNISNKIQQIARDKMSHQVNVYDMMSYTGLLKKIGNGTEMYIPVGKNGDRGFETEILQGQDVQLNTDLMELLRNNYILGTGVPSAIMNYLNEADFAKSIETANTRFAGRVMSLQLDFNASITEFYRRLAKFSGVMNEDEIERFTVMLTPPKFANNLIKNDAISTMTAIKDFVVNIMYGDQWQNDPSKVEKVQELTKRLVSKFMPTLEIEEIEKWMEEIDLATTKKALNPINKNTDNIDIFSDELNGGNGNMNPL